MQGPCRVIGGLQRTEASSLADGGHGHRRRPERIFQVGRCVSGLVDAAARRRSCQQACGERVSCSPGREDGVGAAIREAGVGVFGIHSANWAAQPVGHFSEVCVPRVKRCGDRAVMPFSVTRKSLAIV